MLKVGITGGIGSGKSVVCQVFETLGIPVFYADTAARYLMEHDPAMTGALKELFGPQAYEGDQLNRKYIGSVVFADPDKLKALNELTHPAVIRYGEEWMAAQEGPYALKEAAIFFESGSNKKMDLMIGVTAPLEVRIDRTRSRDHISRQEVLDRMARQMDEAEKMKLCDHVIVNDGLQAIIPQVLQLNSLLLQQAAL